jgi:uncharacterized protein (DUF3820 family)
MHTDSHALSGIRNHDSSVRAGEGSSCLRPRGHCGRLLQIIVLLKLTENMNFGNDKSRFIDILPWFDREGFFHENQ